MSLKIYANIGSGDLARDESGSDFTEMNLANDKLIFSAGSDTVKDGEPIPTVQQLNSAAILITTIDVEVAHFFLADFSENELKEIHLAGNQNKQYVFCAAFDAPTASEPILEIWDDQDCDSIDGYFLGESVANSSFFRGITTTDGLPGEDWTGKRLAGSSDNHFLWLNNGSGALSVAKDLYWNLRITVPASFSSAAAETPCIVIKWTEN